MAAKIYMYLTNVTLLTCLVATSWAASGRVLKVRSPLDGVNPMGGVIFDAVGNLYGTTLHRGGLNGLGYGTAFTLRPTPSGPWSESGLYSFQDRPGENPEGTLVFDNQGNLFGVTLQNPNGTVFELTPALRGYWTQTLIHVFTGADGTYPNSLLRDVHGNLFGTTHEGGTNLVGTAFELSPVAGGGWSFTTLHNFGSQIGDAVFPVGNLVTDSNGNLYGAAMAGGQYSYGAVFELSPMAGGGWSETIIQSFNGLNGNQPTGGLATDNTGNIYGTSCFGGTAQNGVAFKLSPGSGGGWSEQVIHNFGTNPEDGICPSAGLSLDSSGNVYGTTFFGGSLNLGTVFELSLPSGLSWTGQILHSFVGGFDGANPFSEVTLDGAGNLYGTTLFGGSGNGGVVYEITPK